MGENMEEISLNGESLDIVSDNVSKLKEVFPEVITEDKIDFDKLKLILGSDIDTNSERYNFTWPGKTQAIKESQKQSTGTLRPCKEESKNWDTTKNLYIEGDNLEVLKLLQKGYYNKVKMIFIDPPYNTGKDFIYPDNYKDNLVNYLKISGQTNNFDEFDNEDKGIKLTTNTETSGRYHTNWLNMMYPRLKLARNLLTTDGVIFISIDDNEQSNLKKLCDEVFGEENFIRNVIWEKKYSPANDSKVISDNHDHILVYAKNIKNWVMGLLPRTDEMNKRYTNRDNDVRGPWKPGGLSAKTYNANYDYPVKTPSGKVVYPPSGSCWQVSEKRLQELILDNRIYFGVNNDSKPQIKQFLSEVQQGVVPKSIWKFDEVGHNQISRKEITDLFGQFVFDTPKPIKLIQRMIKIANLNDSDIILDFFSGSSSTAHAVIDYNINKNSHYKFIMIQIPEICNEKSFAYSQGYRNIADIGKERIRKVMEKFSNYNLNFDLGFKVFKLDSSNLNQWDPNYNNLEQTLLVSQDNIKEDRTQEDLIYEIMLKYGIDLTLPIEKYDSNENTIYSIGFGALLICLDNKITKDITDAIIELSKDSEISRVVFKDNGFASDADKTNIKETLRTYNIDEFITI